MQNRYAQLPVADHADVVVCGGGTAGVFAAIAAAREGRDVLIIEQLGMLGGSATAGLVTPVMYSGIEGDPPSSSISDQVHDRLIARGASTKDSRMFDPLALKIVLEELCCEAGVRILYHTFIPQVVVQGTQVDSVVIANKSGLARVRGSIFIDCTGDGDVCVHAGAGYTQGAPDTGINQPMSLRYIVGGIDMIALRQQFEELKQQTGVDNSARVSEDGRQMYAACVKNKHFTLTPLFEQAVQNGDLLEEDHLYWQAFHVPSRPGSMAVNSPELFVHINGASPHDLTLAQLEGKQRILRQLEFYKKYLRGFENAYLEDIAVLVGVRESREIATDYVLTAEDLFAKRKHEDMFCQSNYPIDVHGKVLSNTFLTQPAQDGKPWYDIPMRCLYVKGFDNLLVAGRCMGADFAAQASIRVQHSVRSSGEAAGIAAALALQGGIPPRQLPPDAVRARMIEHGARYAEE
ncbi:MAG TPA: FAD-dependent oxidoreductase [Clostridiales bacterium]|nr:FAD-dependent oxidoreductase [Clostridiales bacterium]